MCNQGKQLTVKAQISGETLGLEKDVSTGEMLMEEVRLLVDHILSPTLFEK